jgi:asparagine N-glycosylation enzyme membrane subunit Stt3
MSLGQWLTRSPVPLRPVLPLAVLTGALVGAAFLLWAGMLLHVALLEAGLLTLLISHRRSSDAMRVAGLLALLHAVACAIVLPWTWGRSWQMWGSFTPVVLSRFQPWLLASICALCTVLALAWGRRRDELGRLRRLVEGLVCGLVLLVATAFAAPEVVTSLGDAWTWLARREAFQAMVGESRPLFGFAGRPDLLLPASRLSGLFFLIPVFLVLAMRDLRGGRLRFPGALVVAWTTVLLIVTIFQARFSNSFAVPMCLLIGWSGAGLLGSRGEWPSRGAARVGRILALLLVLVLLLPSLASYAPYLPNQLRWWRGLELEPRRPRKRLLIQVADWIRDNTEEPSGYLDPNARPTYGVLSTWDDGHLIEWVGRRPTVIDNFGDDLGEENLPLSQEYYGVEEARASEILDQLGVRYAIFEHRATPERWDLGPQSMHSRLYFADGAANASSVQIERFAVKRTPTPVPAVRRHRLVFESAPKPRVVPQRPAFKVYEHVRGALLTGRSEPGSRVVARLEVTTNRGRRFEFVSATHANAAGHFMLRFPYSTLDSPPSVATAPRVELLSLGRRLSVAVSEADVREGRPVPVPSFVAERGGGISPVQ